MFRATIFSFVLLLLSANTSSVAQEWQTNDGIEALVTGNTISGVSSVFTSGNRVFASGLRSDLTGYSLYFSDDNGGTWTEASSDSPAGSYSVFASSGTGSVFNYGFDIFGGRYLRTSTDNGENWTNQTPAADNFPAIFLPQYLLADGNTLLLAAAGGNAAILKSTDGGANWSTFTNFAGVDEAQNISDIAQKGNTFWLGSNDGGLYKAASDASQWELVREFGGIGGTDIFDILVDAASGRIYITTTNGIEYSDDDGSTWQTVTATSLGINEGTPDGLVFLGDDLILQMANGANSMMYLIEDLTTATSINAGLGTFESNNRFLNMVTTPSRVFGIRITQETSLWQYGSGSTTSNEAEEVPELFTLNQNYPNPFNPTTNISFTLTQSEYVKVTVSNLLGQQIETLVDGFLPAGAHELRFNAEGLAGGVYMYTLETANTTDTRIMSLLK